MTHQNDYTFSPAQLEDLFQQGLDGAVELILITPLAFPKIFTANGHVLNKDGKQIPGPNHQDITDAVHQHGVQDASASLVYKPI